MDRKIRNLPDLTLTELLTQGVAVVCNDREQAKTLVECMWRDMPKCMSGWEDRDPHWNGEPTIYTLWHKNFAGQWVRNSTGHLMQGFWRNHKNTYTCIAFDDLIIQSDIEESDMPLDFLLS